MKKNRIKPMLMQLAEEEYMCTKCGAKFYGKKRKCYGCDAEFEYEKNPTFK